MRRFCLGVVVWLLGAFVVLVGPSGSFAQEDEPEEREAVREGEPGEWEGKGEETGGFGKIVERLRRFAEEKILPSAMEALGELEESQTLERLRERVEAFLATDRGKRLLAWLRDLARELGLNEFAEMAETYLDAEEVRVDEEAVVDSSGGDFEELMEGDFEELMEGGKNLVQDGKFEEAYEVLSEAARLRPDDAEAHAWLGIAAGQIAGQSQDNLMKMKYGMESFRELDKAVKLDPKNFLGRMARGRARMMAPEPFGSAKGAVKDLEAAVKCEPDNAEAHFWLGKAYEKVGEKEKAKAAWERVLEIDPGFKEAKRAIEEMEYFRFEIFDFGLTVWEQQSKIANRKSKMQLKLSRSTHPA